MKNLEHGSGCGCKDESNLIGRECLLKYIDLPNLRCLNESVTDSCKKIFKTYDNRLDMTNSCSSIIDSPELIFNIQFISPCQITSLQLIGGDDNDYPTKVRIFSDIDNLDFSCVESYNPIQEILLAKDFHGSLEYPLKTTKLSNVTNLSLHLIGEDKANIIKIFYIGLRGKGSSYQRKAVTTIYEAQRNPSECDFVKDNIAATKFGF